jgi:hypothetical protein
MPTTMGLSSTVILPALSSWFCVLRRVSFDVLNMVDLRARERRQRARRCAGSRRALARAGKKEHKLWSRRLGCFRWIGSRTEQRMAGERRPQHKEEACQTCRRSLALP